MRIALTGAGGFTGRFVIKALAARGIPHVALDIDLTDPKSIDHAVQDTDFDCLIHLAARAFVGAGDWQSFYHVNQIGTYLLLDAVSRVRPGARCILASSAQVYGPGAEGLIDEEAPTHPANHYAISKLAMEQGAALWGDRLNIVITRPFNYTGVGQSRDYLIPKIVDHFRRRATTLELGNLWVKRDFGDVRSVADAYAALATAATPAPLVNICTGRLWSIDDILSTLTALSGHRPQVITNPAFVRPNDVATLGGDVTKLRRTLPGWAPRDLGETLRWMYDQPVG